MFNTKKQKKKKVFLKMLEYMFYGIEHLLF